jgi:3-(3-hydroxy-phenyl)propionate hydroxylase
MRPAGRGPLDSLYFTYPIFEPPAVAELSGEGKRHPVAIVGAGPVGMTAALTLAAYAIPSVLIDRKNTFNDGSRAICIARQSFQILEQIGAVEPFLKKSLGWTAGRSIFRNREILHFEMPHGDNEKYLPMYNLEQQYIEQYLWQAVDDSAYIDARWCSEVTDLTIGDAGVNLDVSTPLGDYQLDADYLLAADGARSPVRDCLGLKLSGDNHEGRYVIADVQMAHDYPTERRALFEPASNPGGTVLVHKQPDDIWRIDYQLHADEDADEAVREENIRTRVQAILLEIGHDGDWELEWWSIYTANTLCLDDYRHGRVFFVGDSAHIVPIFGVRGLNNGLADAQNIGWKLAYVLNGEAAPDLLETYSPERRGATLDVFANATKSTRFMTPPSRGYRLMREAALSLSIANDFTRPLANPRQMQPYVYDNDLTDGVPAQEAEFSGGPVPGSACPNLRLADGRYLLEHVGTGFTGIQFGDNGAMPALLAELRAIDRRFQLLHVTGADDNPPANALRTGKDQIAGHFDALPGTFYLLRPDLHVAGRWRTPESGAIADTLKAWIGGKHS